MTASHWDFGIYKLEKTRGLANHSTVLCVSNRSSSHEVFRPGFPGQKRFRNLTFQTGEVPSVVKTCAKKTSEENRCRGETYRSFTFLIMSYRKRKAAAPRFSSEYRGSQWCMALWWLCGAAGHVDDLDIAFASQLRASLLARGRHSLVYPSNFLNQFRREEWTVNLGGNGWTLFQSLQKWNDPLWNQNFSGYIQTNGRIDWLRICLCVCILNNILITFLQFWVMFLHVEHVFGSLDLPSEKGFENDTPDIYWISWGSQHPSLETQTRRSTTSCAEANESQTSIRLIRQNAWTLTSRLFNLQSLPPCPESLANGTTIAQGVQINLSHLLLSKILPMTNHLPILR